MALQEEFEKQGNWLFRYRGILPVILLIAGLYFYLRAKWHPETSFLEGSAVEGYYIYVCFGISLLGLVIRIYTLGYTPKNTSGGNVKKQVAGALNTRGSYSVVRHPLYVGNFFMWFGLMLLTGNPGLILVVCLAYWLYYERIMFAEEQFLREKFGETYTDWANKVPPFIPRFKRFKKPDLNFSWKKILKKEKSALLTLFLVYLLFDFAGSMWNGPWSFADRMEVNYFFAAGSILSLVAYFLIKLLKSRSHILDAPGR